jgi:uncharacterized protein (DUF1800 family)
MNDRAIVARLHRRLGFGLRGGELERVTANGVAAERTTLISAVAEPVASPFDGLELGYENGQVRQRSVAATTAWMQSMTESPDRLGERLAWTWHGILASSVRKVLSPRRMAVQIDLFRSQGLGRYADLLRAVTVDGAMLTYLDGRDSTGTNPNENYSRELLELFGLGNGAFTEADVKAGARALTGWTAGMRLNDTADPIFVPRRHDATPQTYLGTANVASVDSVIEAVTANEACAPFVSGRVLRDLLGPGTDAKVLAAGAAVLKSSSLDVRSLVAFAADRIVAGDAGKPFVSAPVPWFVMARRATGASLDARTAFRGLGDAGQTPLSPPNVSGWPSGDAWNSAATLVARLNLAVAIAKATPPSSPALATAVTGDWAALSMALGLPEPFRASTIAGLSAASGGFSRLALALVSPDFVEV